MYQYDELDQRLVDERVEQFRRQVKRRLDGELSEEQFKPLRLLNGLYLQLHAYMLRIAIPYGSAVIDAAPEAGVHRAPLRQRLRPLHHTSEPAVSLAEARGDA